jgi:DeoR family fructose operon transcriptional repressor
MTVAHGNAANHSQTISESRGTGKLFAEQRKQRILEILNRDQSVRAADLCLLLQASPASVRRDLQELEQAGRLTRTHGGAVSNGTAAFEPSLAEKEDRLRAEKMAIGRVAMELIKQGETVMLDAGSTTLEIARLLRRTRGVTVLTNALNIALELVSSEIEVTVTGGTLRQRTQSLVGPITENVLAGLHVDKLFLATNGLDLKRGLTTPNVSEAQSKRAMIESAREVIVVADHGKFGCVAFSQICSFDKVHCLITDAAAPAEFLKAVARIGVKVMQAGEST